MTRAHAAHCTALLLGCGPSGDPPMTSAQAFGQQLGKVSTEIFKRHVVRSDPPSARLCEQVGSGGPGGGET